MRCLKQILGITWQDRITHDEIFLRTQTTTIETIMMKQHLRCSAMSSECQNTGCLDIFCMANCHKEEDQQGHRKRDLKTTLKTS